MRNVSLGIVLTTVAAMSQTVLFHDNYTVLGDYLGGIIYPGDSTITVEDRVYYPGLRGDSTRTAALGFRSGLGGFTSSVLSSRSYMSVSDLYGWGQVPTCRGGTIGAWLGGLRASDQAESYGDESKSREASGQGALWFVPGTPSRLRGLSLVVDGRYLKGEEWGPSGYYPYSTVGQSESDHYLSAAAIALFRARPEAQLRLAVQGDYQAISDHGRSASDYSDRTWTSSSAYTAVSVTAGLIGATGRQVNGGIEVSRARRHKGDNYWSSVSTDDTPGTREFFVDFSQGRRFSYKGHSAYVGVHAHGAYYSFFESTSSLVDALDIQPKGTVEDNAVQAFVEAPVTLQVLLFHRPLYGFVKLTPRFSASRGSSHSYPQSWSYQQAGFSLYQVSLGLKGRVGDRIQFCVVPSLDSKVFMSGLEISYKFPARTKTAAAKVTNIEDGDISE